MSIEEIRTRASRLEHIVSRRNLREYIAGAIGIVGFLRLMWIGPTTTIRVGAALTIAGGVFVLYLLRKWGSANPLPEDLGLTSAVDFHRAQLERQRDLLRNVWSWYLMPFVPGLAVTQVGIAMAHPERTQRLVALGIGVCLMMVAVAAVNRYGAARIQKRIDSLPSNP
ncbi:MAG TPA: hypothetical protein VFA59_13770 [Vicinamibacterales bacterium]|nr:hypothetical protein [Vicinamibacterales bacterium]